MTTTVLVVGGRGEIGLPVVRRLLEDGFRVRVLVRAPWPDRPAEAEEVVGDVDDIDSLRRAISGCDGVHVSLRGGAREGPLALFGYEGEHDRDVAGLKGCPRGADHGSVK